MMAIINTYIILKLLINLRHWRVCCILLCDSENAIKERLSPSSGEYPNNVAHRIDECYHSDSIIRRKGGQKIWRKF